MSEAWFDEFGACMWLVIFMSISIFVLQSSFTKALSQNIRHRRLRLRMKSQPAANNGPPQKKRKFIALQFESATQVEHSATEEELSEGLHRGDEEGMDKAFRQKGPKPYQNAAEVHLPIQERHAGKVVQWANKTYYG